jgi:2-iminobutanoate/2-iminopropanoate deaminase
MFIRIGAVSAPDLTGDISAQTRGVLERARGLLSRAGSSLDRAMAITVFLRSASDFQAMNAVYASFWPRDYPTRTTVVTEPSATGSRLEMSFIAAGPGTHREIVHPSNWMKSPSPYSYAIRSGDTVFLSGLVARNGRDNSSVNGDAATQTRVILDNAGELLQAAGLSHAHIASSRVYLTDTGSFQAMNGAYAAYFPVDPPARATVVSALAGPQYSVEMTVTASSGQRRSLGTVANLPLSSGIVANRTIYLSGMLGFDDSNTHDAAAQTRATLSKLGRALNDGGALPSHVVESTVYVTDARLLPDVSREYAAFFGSNSPARTDVVCGLVAPGGLVEIMLTAQLP